MLAVLGLSACQTTATGVTTAYGSRTFEVTPEQEYKMQQDSARIQAAERAERVERRAERREEMMNEADAIQRAYGTQTININRTNKNR